MRLSLLPFPVALALSAAHAQQRPGRVTPLPPEHAHAAAGAATLPVTSVSLYKNGVGYFEHTGHVTGDGAVTIDFTSAQLNDVLQSLTAIDLGGGRIAGAGYNSTTPLEQQLRTLPFTLGEDSSAADFYAAIRGARVSVSAPGGAITGRLLSVEVRTTTPGDDTSKPAAERRYLTVVSDSGEVRTLELTSATSVRLLDPALQQSVGRYLQLVESNRSQGLRHLTLEDHGTGTREVRVSYISEVPVWKSTYRLLFTPSATATNGGTATLQGWSVVDNTTGADWINVHLSLIAGAPQSFIQPLSQPIYSRRPEIPIAVEAQLAPQTFDSSMEQDKQFDRLDRFAKLAPGVVPPPPPPPSPSAANETVAVTAMALDATPAVSRNFVQSKMATGVGGMENLMYQQLASNSLQVNSSTSAFDDFFSYTLDSPVTILKNQSALVPILQAKIPAESVSLVSYANGRVSQPLRALWLTNSTNLTLDRGSFTVIESGNFAGEGLLDPVHANEKRLVSYAADQAVHVTTEGDRTTNHVILIHGSKGVVNIHRADIHELTLVFHNAAAARRTMVSEIPVVNGWTLDSARDGSTDPKPVETTATVYRYKTEVDAGATVKLHIGATHSGFTTYYLNTSNDSQITFLLNETSHNPAFEAALQPVINARHNVADAEERVKETEAKLSSLRSDEDRQRANITALAGADHAARERFVNDLNKTEDNINAAQAELTQRQKALADAKAEFSQALENFSINEKVGP